VKILYALGNREGSYFQYKRFLQSINHKDIELQVAGYQKSIQDLNVDYTLDALLNFSKDDTSITYNGNYNYYYKQIQSFTPDLIISDLEVYTSIIALELNIQLWQVSPLLLLWSLPKNIHSAMNILALHSYPFNFGSKDIRAKFNHVVKQSNKRYVVSHLCDTQYASNIREGFDWSRPEFELDDNISNNISPGYEITTADLFYNQSRYEFHGVNQMEPEALIVSETDKFYSRESPMSIQINDNVKFLRELL
jgi:hypothetical protein